MLSLRIVARRILRNWRMMLTVLVGVVVACALFGSAPLYSVAITELGLRHTLATSHPIVANVQVFGEEALTEGFYGRIEESIGWLLTDRVTVYKAQAETAQRLHVLEAGQDALLPGEEDRRLGIISLYALSGLDEHVDVVEGRLPRNVQPAPIDPNDLKPPRQIIEMVTGPTSARLAEMNVGDRLILGGELEVGPTFEFILVGLVDAHDPREDYWMGELQPFEGDPLSGVLHAFILPQAVNQQVAVGEERHVTKSWRLLVDRNQVTAANMDQVEATLRNLTSTLKQWDSTGRIVTGLSDVIKTYRDKVDAVRTPLFLLMAEVLALVLYYLVMTAALVLDQELNELAVLRSRGSSYLQLLRWQFVQAICLCAPAAVVGPYLAAWGLRRLYVLLVPAGLAGGGAPLHLGIGHDARVMASVAAGLCVAALLLPVIPSARRSIVAWKALLSRPPQKSAWQRVYLDLFLLAVGGMLYWQLRSSGSFVSRRLSGAAFADPLLLITPALFMVAAALVLLRLFPPGLALVGRAIGQLRSAPITLGIWHVSRNPVHYSRLLLLLSLTVGLGLFTSLYGTSLHASQQARARSVVGSDARLRSSESVLHAVSPASPLWERATALPEAKAASPVFRQDETYTTGQAGLSLLAVDPATFGQVARYEPGRSPVSVTQLMDLLAPDGSRSVGIPLSGKPNAMGVWLLPQDRESGYVALEFVLRDDAWRFVTVPVAQPDPASLEWQFLDGRIGTTTDDGWPIAYPLDWVATRVRSTRPGQLSSVQYHNARVVLDEVQVGLAGQTLTIVADFEDDGQWALPAPRASTNRLRFELTMEQPSPGGGQGMLLTMRFSSEAGVVLESEPLTREPIRAIVNWPFLQSNTLEPGDEFDLWVGNQELPFVAHSVINRFPTLDVDDTPFVVCNLFRLLEASSRNPALAAPFPQEVWVEAADDRARPLLKRALADLGEVEVLDAWQITSELQAEPLALGLRGGLRLGFLVAWGLSAVGLMAYSVLTARQRSLEFGVLRAVGLSSGQMLRQLATEQVILIVLALLAGSLLGLGLAQTMQPYVALAVRPWGGDAGTVTRIVVDWAAVGQMYLLWIASLAVALMGMLFLLARLRLGWVLRLGE